MNEQLLAKARQEFDRDLDAYMAEWEKSLRAKVAPPSAPASSAKPPDPRKPADFAEQRRVLMAEGHAAFAERFLSPEAAARQLSHMPTEALQRLRDRLATPPAPAPAAPPAGPPPSRALIVRPQKPQPIIVHMAEPRTAPARDPLLAALVSAVVAISRQKPPVVNVPVEVHPAAVTVHPPAVHVEGTTVHLPQPGRQTQTMTYDDRDRITTVTREG